MTIGKIDRYDVLNTPKDNKPAVTIWFSGCTRQCGGCHNPRLWDKNNGQEYTVRGLLFAICTILEKYNMDTVVLLGGEPMEQNQSELKTLVERLCKYGYKVWLYTGNEFEDIPNDIKQYLYTIKCGSYNVSLAQEGFPSSSNQRLFRMVYGEWEQITL